MIRAVGDVLIVVTTLQFLEWVLAYHRLTGGTWRDTRMGVHVMCFMSALGAVLLLSSVRVVVADVMHERSDPLWFRVLRLVVFVSIPVVVMWRRILLRDAQSGDPDTPAEGTPAAGRHSR